MGTDQTDTQTTTANLAAAETPRVPARWLRVCSRTRRSAGLDEVHLVQTLDATTSVTLCGARLPTAAHAVLAHPSGPPCSGCVLTLCGLLPDEPEAAVPSDDASTRTWADYYAALSWPVITHRDHVLLAAESSPRISVVSIAADIAPDVLQRLSRRCEHSPVLIPAGVPGEWLFLVTATGIPVPALPEVRRVDVAVPLPPARVDGCSARWLAPPSPSRPLCTDVALISAAAAVMHVSRQPPPHRKGLPMRSDDAVLDCRTPGAHWTWPSVDQDRAAPAAGAVDIELLRRVRRGLRTIGNDAREDR